MSKGSSQKTTTTSGPPQQFLNAYTNLVNAGTSLASQPLQQYTGPLVAGLTPDQQQAFGTIANSQGIAMPFINASAQYGAQGATPISVNGGLSDAALYGVGQTGLNTLSGATNTNIYGQLPQWNSATASQYMSPYTQNVVNATEAQMNQQNAVQQNNLKGNAIASGAWGGDRSAVAQAQLAGQQQLAEAPTIANLYNQGYTNAQGEFNTQQALQAQTLAQQTGLSLSAAQQLVNAYQNQQGLGIGAQEATNQGAQNAAYLLGNLGGEALNTTLAGAQAQAQAGTAQQQLAQEQLNVPYQQYLQQQAYPYQNLNFLAGLTFGAPVGNTSTTTQSTSPSWFAKGGRARLQGGGIAPSIYQLEEALNLGREGIPTVSDQYGIASNVPDISSGYIPSNSTYGANHQNSASSGISGGSSSQGSGGNIFSDLTGAVKLYKAIDTGTNIFPWLGGLLGLKEGGRANHYDAGGPIGPTGIASNVPDVSNGYIPANSPISANSPMTSGVSSGSIGGGGGGGGSSGSGSSLFSDVLAIGGLLLGLKEGGRANHYDAGGPIGPTGIATPQLDPAAIIGARPSGDYFNPLPQYHSPTPPITIQNSNNAGRFVGPIGGGIAKNINKVAPLTTTLTPGMLGSALGLFADGGDVGDDGDGGDDSEPDNDQDESQSAPPSPTGGIAANAPTSAPSMRPTASAAAPTNIPPEQQDFWQRIGFAPTHGSGTAFDYHPGNPGWGDALIAGLGTALAKHSIGAGFLGGLQTYEHEKELDEKPTVDHSGATIRVYYPGEGWLDSGLPTAAAMRLTASQQDKLAKQEIPLTAEEAKAAGFRPGTVVVKNGLGDYRVVQQPLSPSELEAGAGTWSVIGTDPTTGNPVMFNNRTQQTRIGKSPVTLKGSGGLYGSQPPQPEPWQTPLPVAPPAEAASGPKLPAGVPPNAKYSPSQHAYWWQQNGQWMSAPAQ